MRINHSVLLLPLVLFFTGLAEDVRSQISASTTSGCAPLTGVLFSHAFFNPQNINWDFDDGASSPLPQPTHTFANAGSYDVVFTATVNGSPVNETITIDVYSKPTVSFTVNGPFSGCVGQSISFDDNSTGGSGSQIVEWSWSFGDGGVDTDVNPTPSYAYSLPGIFDVDLIVTDANGCSNALTQNDLIIISNPPTITVTTNPNPPVSCSAPFTVNFASTVVSQSPVGNEVVFDWDFGNGQTSVSEDPGNITYSTEGTYEVVLTATDANGCSAEKIVNVSATLPFADFDVVGGENDTVCLSVDFINNSQGAIQVINYGDGMTGTQLSHVYPAEGWYDVTFTVGGNQCVDDTTVSIFVQVPTVTIDIVPDTICGVPAVFVINAISDYSITTYTWTKPSDNSVVEGSETITDTITTYTELEYSINEVERKSVNLQIVTDDGCEASASEYVYVVKPNALFFPDTLYGCSPLTLVFSDSSTTEYSSITQWKWHFGDGSNPVTSNNGNDVTHVYTQPGTYYPYLVITTAAGCVDTSFTHEVLVGSPPDAAFTISPTSFCPGEPVQLTDITPAADSVDTWNFSGDAGLLFSCADEPNPIVEFVGEATTSQVTMTVGFNGCYSSTTQTITLKGPIGRIEYSCNCDTPMDYPFSAITSNADYWDWDFGDGTVIANSTASNISHTYSTSGNYWAKLISYNSTSGCEPFRDSILVRVRDVEAGIALEDFMCAGVSYSLDASASVDVAGQADGCYRNYLWYFNDGTRPQISSGPSINHVFNTPSQFINVELFVEDVNGCMDSTSQTVFISGINSVNTIQNATGCLPLTVTLSDLSTSDTTLTAWSWNFGDGNSSSAQNPVYTYTEAEFNNAGNVIPYTGTLTVTNAHGCTDVSNFTVTPIVPNANFQNTTARNICAGGTVTFKATGSPEAGNTFVWQFSDGGSETGFQVTHTFEDPGSYSVTLTVTNSIGCTNSKTTNNYVNVQAYPDAGFSNTASETETLCYPALVTYTDTSIVQPFGSRKWDLGNGSPTIGNQSIGTTYTQPGEYTVSLIVKTTFGCADTAYTDIVVEGPVGNFTINPNPICRGDEVSLTLTDTTDVMTWGWDFGDGKDTSAVNPIVHEYDFNFNPVSGQTLISLVLWNQDSICSHVETGTIQFFQALADFRRNNEQAVLDSIHCAGIPDVFTNASSANINEWAWDFGNGQTYNGSTPPPVNYTAGTYEVTLAVKATPPGCVDTISKVMVIHPLPDAVASGGEICTGDATQLFASGGETYSWSPADDLDDPTSPNPIASPEVTTNYVVTVTDTNACVNTASALLTVYVPFSDFDVLDTIIIGEEYVLDFPNDPSYVYNWSPDLWVNCTTCPNPVFQPLANTEYTVIVSDVLGCFDVTSYLEIIVLPLASIDVPDVFTPDGDGINDVVYVRGWGIENLLEFKIFNRWGELVFDTNDIDEGWDGFYKGKLQPSDTYSYIAKVKPYIDDKPMVKTGFINILR